MTITLSPIIGSQYLGNRNLYPHPSHICFNGSGIFTYICPWKYVKSNNPSTMVRIWVWLPSGNLLPSYRKPPFWIILIGNSSYKWYVFHSHVSLPEGADPQKPSPQGLGKPEAMSSWACSSLWIRRRRVMDPREMQGMSDWLAQSWGDLGWIFGASAMIFHSISTIWFPILYGWLAPKQEFMSLWQVHL